MSYALRHPLLAIVEEVDDAENSDGQTSIQIGMALQRIRDHAKRAIHLLDNPEIEVPKGEPDGTTDY